MAIQQLIDDLLMATFHGRDQNIVALQIGRVYVSALFEQIEHNTGQPAFGADLQRVISVFVDVIEIHVS